MPRFEDLAAEGQALVEVGGEVVGVDVATQAELDAAQAAAVQRANHTGTQPVSTVTGLQGVLDAKAPLASPALTGTPTVPTAPPGTNTTQAASTAFVTGAVDNATSVVLPSGDITGATDRAAIEAAIAEAVATGGTVVLGRGGSWYIDSRITVPQGVNLWGHGSGHTHAATRIVCTTAEAGIAFGTRTTGGRGGLSGSFVVDGNGIATQPLYVGMTVLRTFLGMESLDSAGEGLVLEAGQNNTYVNTVVTGAAAASVVFDYGTAGNQFLNLEADTGTTWHVVFRQSGASPAGLNDKPYGNHIWGGILERGVLAGGVWNQAGELNELHGVQIVHAEDVAAFDLVRVDDGLLKIDGGVVQSNTAGQGTAFNVNGGKLVVTGEPTIASVGTIFDNAGTIDLDGQIHAVGYTTHTVGTAPNEPARYGQSSLGSIPVVAAGSGGLGTDPAAVPASWWRLDPANWPTAPNGRSLQYRLHFTAMGLTAGDVVGALLYNATDGAGLFAEVTATAAADGLAEVVSPWAAFPSSAKGGYLMARNITAARGNAASAFIEVAIR